MVASATALPAGSVVSALVTEVSTDSAVASVLSVVLSPVSAVDSAGTVVSAGAVVTVVSAVVVSGIFPPAKAASAGPFLPTCQTDAKSNPA